MGVLILANFYVFEKKKCDNIITTIMAASVKTGRDFYQILGVEKTAGQGQIKQAYRKKAIKFHPDKNPGNEEAAEKFKELSTAYAVLSDPNKKRQYDLHGEDGSTNEFGSLNGEELGTMGRIFGALISKAGIPLPTEITTKVLPAAQHLSQGVTEVPGLEIPKVTTLEYGQTVSGVVERQSAHFFQIDVTESDMKNGIIVNCVSNGGDKFKVVFFDKDGQVNMVEESQTRKKKSSEANLFLVSFDRYNLSDTMPLSLLKKLDEDIPPVFMILDTFEKEVRSILPGRHLFCVYGDNWFQSVKYNLKVLVAEPRDEMNAIKIMESEIRLADKKEQLEKFQPEFCELKKKYEEACKTLEGDIKEIDELIKSREMSYSEYIQSSSNKYQTYDNRIDTVAPQSGGLFGSIGKIFSTGKKMKNLF